MLQETVYDPTPEPEVVPEQPRFSLKAKLAIAGAALLFILVLGTLLWLANTPKTVLYKKTDMGGPANTERIVSTIFNPLRDRAPELPANELLQQIHDSGCKKALSDWYGDYRKDYVKVICDEEQQHPLQAWELNDRTDDFARHMVTLQYKAQRISATGNYEDLIWVIVEKRDGAWKVTKYDAVY